MDPAILLNQLLQHAPALGMHGRLQFILPPTHRLGFEIAEQVHMLEGSIETPDVQIELPLEQFLGVVEGREDIEQLFTSGLLKITGQLGLATLLPQLIEASRRNEAPTPPPAAPSNSRYPAPERASDRLSATQVELLEIERKDREHLSVETFRERYLPQGIPVIINNALNDWPLFNMSREQSLAYFAELQGITRHGDYAAKTFSTERDFRSTSMAEFIARLDDPTLAADSDRPAVYMGNNVVPEQLIALIRYPDYFPRELYIKPRIWIGPKGTLTPLHRDDSDNLFAQVWGQKSFILAAPHHREALGTWSTSEQGGLEGCAFNPNSPDYETYPQAQAVQLYRIVLEAGDLLFLPDGWFHEVASVTTSLSVNFWVDSGR